MAKPELLDQSIIKRACKLSTALLCDGMKGLGVVRDGCMDADIMPINPAVKMCGTAMTVRTDNGDNFPIHVATYSAGEGYVMIIDGNDYADGPYFGDLIMGAAQAVGMEGMVVNGFCRDREGCLAMNFPVYCKGIMQRGVKKKDPGEINIPIICGGVQVNPGDLVVGDMDGVTVVPRELVQKTLDQAEEKLAYEKKREERIAEYREARLAGQPLPQLAPQWVLDLLAGDK